MIPGTPEPGVARRPEEHVEDALFYLLDWLC